MPASSAPGGPVSPAESFGLSELGQIALTVGDLQRAVAFYRDALGMKFLFEAPPRMAFFDCGGLRPPLAEGPASAPPLPRGVGGMTPLSGPPPRMPFFAGGGTRLLLGEGPASAAGGTHSSSVLY